MSSLNLVAEIYQAYICIMCIYLSIYLSICLCQQSTYIQCHTQPYFATTESEQAPKYFQDRTLSKDPRPGWKVHFKTVWILYIPKKFLTAPKTIGRTFQFHRVDIFTCLKKNSEYITTLEKRRPKLNYKSTASYNDSQ